jgi:hypothetical protein
MPELFHGGSLHVVGSRASFGSDESVGPSIVEDAKPDDSTVRFPRLVRRADDAERVRSTARGLRGSADLPIDLTDSRRPASPGKTSVPASSDASLRIDTRSAALDARVFG